MCCACSCVSLHCSSAAYLDISVAIAAFDEYTAPLIDHVLLVKLCHWDPCVIPAIFNQFTIDCSEIRDLAARTLHRLTAKAPEYVHRHLAASIISGITSFDLDKSDGVCCAMDDGLQAPRQCAGTGRGGSCAQSPSCAVWKCIAGGMSLSDLQARRRDCHGCGCGAGQVRHCHSVPRHWRRADAKWRHAYLIVMFHITPHSVADAGESGAVPAACSIRAVICNPTAIHCGRLSGVRGGANPDTIGRNTQALWRFRVPARRRRERCDCD